MPIRSRQTIIKRIIEQQKKVGQTNQYITRLYINVITGGDKQEYCWSVSPLDCQVYRPEQLLKMDAERCMDELKEQVKIGDQQSFKFLFNSCCCYKNPLSSADSHNIVSSMDDEQQKLFFQLREWQPKMWSRFVNDHCQQVGMSHLPLTNDLWVEWLDNHLDHDICEAFEFDHMKSAAKTHGINSVDCWLERIQQTVLTNECPKLANLLLGRLLSGECRLKIEKRCKMAGQLLLAGYGDSENRQKYLHLVNKYSDDSDTKCKIAMAINDISDGLIGKHYTRSQQAEQLKLLLQLKIILDFTLDDLDGKLQDL